jgi:hypothetical protein
MTSRTPDDHRTSPFDAALRAARSATGNAETVERLRVQLQGALTGQAASAPHVQAGQPLAAASLGKLPWLVAGCVAFGVAGYLAVNSAARTSRVPARGASALAPLTRDAMIRKAPVPRREPNASAPTAAAEPTRPASLAQAKTSAAAPSSAPLSAADLAAGAPHAVHSRGPAQTAAVPATPARAEAKPREHSRLEQRDARAALPADPTPPAAGNDSASEVALITQAQALLDQHPEAALAVLLEHARHFPRGLLAEERDVLRFDAERALGHTAQAIADAQAFCAQHPASPQVRRLERWLAAQTNAAALHKQDR